MPSGRLEWVDTTKGICVLLFVLLHVLEHAGAQSIIASSAANWLSPFTVPAFVLMAGLFLQPLLFGSKSKFFDRKVVFFVYFYILWTVIETIFIHFTLVTQPFALALAFVQRLLVPAGGLWLIQLLVVMNLLTWFLRFVRPSRLAAIAMFTQLCASANIINTGVPILDDLSAYYVFYLLGYIGSSLTLKFGKEIAKGFEDILPILLIWAGMNTVYVALNIADIPLISLFMGASGALAIMGLSILVLDSRLGPGMHYIGQNSFAVCLGFLIPVTLAFKYIGLQTNPALSLFVCVSTFILGVGFPLLAEYLFRRTGLRYLFVRPGTVMLAPAKRHPRTGLLLNPEEQNPQLND